MLNIKIFGIVQGVGFRPFVSRIAAAHKISGTVANRGSYVEIFAQGTADDLQKFLAALQSDAPPRSAILNVTTLELPDKNFDGFKIVDSVHEAGDIFVAPDIAVCDKCAAELFDTTDRRYLHPFINCTACGPRLTILQNMPYDRERTSMSDFPMCDKCAAEYHNPDSRRFDAQPVCCNDCGPEVYLLNSNLRGHEAIRHVRKILAEGGVVAVKGIGGFHLSCDARNFSAVERLRNSKTRPTKPFAVMFSDVAAVERECLLTAAQLKFLDSPQKPICLLQKKIGGTIAPNVAPNINRLGAMLPYTPLHLLLFKFPDTLKIFPDALIMTSGNPSGAPITIDDGDALKNFDFCDAILSHDRKILLRADDSVVDFVDDVPAMIRRSRGYAPLPIVYDTAKAPTAIAAADSLADSVDDVPAMIRRSICYDAANTPTAIEAADSVADSVDDVPAKIRRSICYDTAKAPTVLAIGGELKNSFCLAKNNLLYASPYIGDVGDLRTVVVLKASIERMRDLLEISPEVIACDLHPRYQTTALAEELAAELDVPLVKVQHHFAHVLSCLAENNHHGAVIGVAFDGTGYGTDGTIWGGEFFICDDKTFERAATISAFRQAGGDKSAREGWRIAQAIIGDIALARELNLADEKNLRAQKFLLDNNLNCVTSTSAGRLFDAVAAVLNICRVSSYEGEAAIRLQAAAERSTKNFHADCATTDEIFAELVTSRLSGENIFDLARFFHVSLAALIGNTCAELSLRTKIKTVALSGGVFQNSLLSSLACIELERRGLKVLRHSMTPANDGGICLGQAVHARARLMA